MKKNKYIIYGNSVKVWIGAKIGQFGRYLVKKAENIIEKGENKVISNPDSKFLNPFVLVVNFSINNTKKYQILLEGAYASKFREFNGETTFLTEDDLLTIIKQNPSKWYLKQEL